MTSATQEEHALFDALHDPTRRAVLELLRNGERSVRDLTDQLPVSQSAVSQHLKVLTGAGLTTARPDGRRRLYRVDHTGLGHLRAWVDRFWDEALTAFADYATEAIVDQAPAERPSEDEGSGDA
ncbi:MAG: metalloregulator ArsR/SmtB family transcription factor [Actinomycetota bacterium]